MKINLTDMEIEKKKQFSRKTKGNHYGYGNDFYSEKEIIFFRCIFFYFLIASCIELFFGAAMLVFGVLIKSAIL